jgi:hypothetical protein
MVALDLGCVPERAISGAVLVQTERSCFLTFNATQPGPDGVMHPAGVALIEFLNCRIAQFGYPNDEAYRGHPLFAKTAALGEAWTGTHEVRDSTWIRCLEQQNRVAFPDSDPWQGARHFIIEFHESTFECIADGLRLELMDVPYGAVFERIAKRVISE